MYPQSPQYAYDGTGLLTRIALEPARLVIINGMPGSGKTSLSSGIYDAGGRLVHPGLLHKIHATWLDKDTVDSAYPTDLTADEWARIARRTQYPMIDSLARAQLSRAGSVVIDAPYNREVLQPGWWSRYETMTRETGAVLKVIRCYAPADVIRERLVCRGLARDASKLADWFAFLQREPYLDGVSLPEGSLLLNTSAGPEEALERVLAYVRT